MDCDKSQYGGDCQSSTSHEKDQADAHNNLCQLNPKACVPDTSPEHLLELAAFGTAGFTAMALGPSFIAKALLAACSIGARCVTGTVGAVTYMGGNIAAQLFFAQKVDLLDVLAAGGAGFVAGYVMPGTTGKAALTYILTGGGQQVTSDVLHGRNVQWGLVFFNAGLSGALGMRFGLYTPKGTLLQASTSEIWKASHGSVAATAAIAFKNASNIWAYVPNAMKFANVLVSTVTSAVSNGIPALFVNPNQR